jgi:hypothetical protein
VELPFRFIILQSRKLKGYEFPTISKQRDVTCKLKKNQRTVKHIWFLPKRKANAEKQKELALPHRHPNKIFTFYTQLFEINKINLLN